jgi:hypothetical protein
MAFTNKQILDAATIRWVADFQAGMAEGLARKAANLDRLASTVEGATVITDPLSKESRIVFKEHDPRLFPDEGQVTFTDQPIREISVKAEHFQKGWAEDLENLRMPLYLDLHGQTASMSGMDVMREKYRTLWQRLLEGDTATYGTAYDGQFMFDTDHPGALADGTSTTYANLFDLALSETNLATVVTTMLDYRNVFGAEYGNEIETGEMMNPQGSRDERQVLPPTFHLYVGNKNWKTAQDLAAMAKSDPSAFAGNFTFSTEPFITGADDDYWFVQFYDPRRRPIAHIDGGSTLIPSVGYDTEAGRLARRAEWVVRATWGHSYKDWHCMAMCRQ